MAKRNTVKATFTLERRYRASPERVFRAFSDEDAKRHWFGGPEGWEQLEKAFDFRVDGVEVNVGRHPNGVVSAFRCTYHDIVPSERIVYAYRMEIDGAPMSSSLATIEIRRDGDGSRLTLTEYGVYFDGFSEMAHDGRERGTRWLLDRLGAFLEGTEAPPFPG